MPKINSNKKGRELEQALRFIQETILHLDPKFRGTECSIESNKIIVVSGVRHEIDLLVRTLPGSQYEASWLFECKNQKESAGKNQVMLLAAKVNAVGANRGILVAKRLSRDAQAQLKLENRLSFVAFTQDFISPLSDVQLVFATHKPQPIKIYFKQRGVPPCESPAISDWKKTTFCLNGKRINLALFIKEHVDQISAGIRKAYQQTYRPDGTYTDGQGLEIRFTPNEFSMDGADIDYMVIEVRFDITIQRKKVVSKFELDGQGRSYSFEPIDNVIPGKRLEINLVEILKPSTSGDSK